MSTTPAAHAARLGLTRGLIETRQSLTDKVDLTYTIVINGILLIVVVLQRGATIEGTSTSLAAATLPSLLGMTIVMGGFIGASSIIAAHREDGTLLRAKATPNGMVGYLVAQIVLSSVLVLLGVAVLLVAGLLLVDDLAAPGPAEWFTLVWVLGVGLVATMTWGATFGALVRSSSSGFGLGFLLIGGIVAISGIFYPISALAGWLQGLAQLFPVYWLGLGMRSVLLADPATEITGSWRHIQTAVVLTIWAVAGLLIAPPVLRRMARRESGSAVEARKQRFLQRGY